MKIQNNNVSVELARKALDCVPFVLDVISVCQPCQMDRDSANKRYEWQLNTHSYDDVVNMIHSLPICLVKGKGEEYPEDLLGAYQTGNGNTSPYIKLYVEEIKSASGDNDQKFKWLFTKVLLHETMHAIMDINNQVSFNGTPALIYQKGYVQWREESYANAGALWIIREYAKKVGTTDAKDFVKFVERFMIMNQVDGYTLGIYVADFPTNYIQYWIEEKINKKIEKEELLAWWKNVPKNKKTEFLDGNSPDFEHAKGMLAKECEYDERGNYYQRINRGQGGHFNIDDYIENIDDMDIYNHQRNVTEVLRREREHRSFCYTLNPIIEKLLKGEELTDQEKQTFQKCISKNTESQYLTYPHPCDKDNRLDRTSLDILVKSTIELLGVECNLNWIIVSHVQNFRGLFLHSKFNGDISQWAIKNEDCSYMFAFSEFDNWENLPWSLQEELIQPTGKIDTTGIFHGCKGEKKFINIIAEERKKRGIQS